MAVPAAALLTLLGASTALAATTAAPTAGSASPAKASTLTWHNFTLFNGWKTAGTAKASHPGWAIKNGVVYLRGAVKHPGPTTDENFASLPNAHLPAHDTYIQIYTLGSRPGTLLIQADGTLAVFSGNSTKFASLAAVSFPAPSIKEHKLTLTNGWASGQSKYGTGNPSYAVSRGVVHLTGTLLNGAPGTIAFTLPMGTRPSHLMYLAVYTFNGSLGGFVQIFKNGQVAIWGAATTNLTSLANISYPAPGATWHNFKLTDDWASAQGAYGTGNPAYTVIDGVRYLSGSMLGALATKAQWTRLPAAARSPSALEIEVYTVNGSTGSIGITSSVGRVASSPFGQAQQFTSLAGIAYAPGA